MCFVSQAQLHLVKLVRNLLATFFFGMKKITFCLIEQSHWDAIRMSISVIMDSASRAFSTATLTMTAKITVMNLQTAVSIHWQLLMYRIVFTVNL